jgi:hypothetical protein
MTPRMRYLYISMSQPIDHNTGYHTKARVTIHATKDILISNLRGAWIKTPVYFLYIKPKYYTELEYQMF